MPTGRSKSKARPRGKTIFFPPQNRRLSGIITIKSPEAFRQSIRKLSADGLDAREKRVLVLAQNRARAMLKKKSQSQGERKELGETARLRLPPVTKRVPGRT